MRFRVVFKISNRKAAHPFIICVYLHTVRSAENIASYVFMSCMRSDNRTGRIMTHTQIEKLYLHIIE